MRRKFISILFLIMGVMLFPSQSKSYTIIWDTSSRQTVFTPGTANWEKDAVNNPFVMYDSGVYKMWYGGAAYQGPGTYDNIYGIGYVISTDGVNWTNRQLVHGPYSNYRATGSPYVIKEGSTYRMWHFDYYEWIAGDWSNYISHMTSPNGINWGSEQKVLSAQGQSNPQGDGYCVYNPSILKEGSQYTMWYAVNDHPGPGVGGPAKIWRATSSDGINWGNRQLSLPYIPGTWEGSVACPNVVKEPGGEYVMYYSTDGGWTGRAKSIDGINWTEREQILTSASTPFYFHDPNSSTPYLYFTQGSNIVRIKGDVIPEPGTFLLLGAGLIGLVARLRKKL